MHGRHAHGLGEAHDVPPPDQSAFALGAGGEQTLNAAACSSDGDSVILYLSHPTTVSLHLNKITAAATVHVRWVNPETSVETKIGEFPATGTRSFSTPEGWPDAVLLLDAVETGLTGANPRGSDHARGRADRLEPSL